MDSVDQVEYPLSSNLVGNHTSGEQVENPTLSDYSKRKYPRSKICIDNYVSKRLPLLDSVELEKILIEKEHGISFVHSGKSLQFKDGLGECIQKNGKSISERQKFCYSANTPFPVEYTGNPYIVLEETGHHCQFGWTKGRIKALKKKGGSDFEHESIKPLCSAQILVRKLIIFSKIEAKKETEYEKKKTSGVLQSILREWSTKNYDVDFLKERTGAEVTFSCWFPKAEAHDVDHTSEQCSRIHPQIVAYIRQMAENGVTSAPQMITCVDHFVKHNFPEASLEENLGKKRYWPEAKHIKCAMNNWITRKKIVRTPRTKTRASKRENVLNPIDYSKLPKKRRKPAEALSTAEEVWIDEYGNPVYSLSDCQASEVVLNDETFENTSSDRRLKLQGDFQAMVQKLTELSLKISDIGLLEFAHHQVSEIVSALETGQDCHSNNYVESGVWEDDVTGHRDELGVTEDVVWVSLDEQSNELIKCEKPEDVRIQIIRVKAKVSESSVARLSL